MQHNTHFDLKYSVDWTPHTSVGQVSAVGFLRAQYQDPQRKKIQDFKRFFFSFYFFKQEEIPASSWTAEM